jgi:hypothetical protein
MDPADLEEAVVPDGEDPSGNNGINGGTAR